MEGLRVEVVASSSDVARSLSDQYRAELAARDVGIDPPGVGSSAHEGELDPPHGCMLVATLDAEPVGVLGVRDLGGGVSELKQMWVDPAARGRGIGRAMLRRAESEATRRFGASRVVLDTHPALVEAVSLYLAEGWVEVAAYNENRFAALWFEKRTGAAPADAG